MLDHLGENALQFGNLSIFDASTFEHFNHIKITLIRKTSLKLLSTMEKTVEAMNMVSAAKRHAFPNTPRTRTAQLFRVGVKDS